MIKETIKAWLKVRGFTGNSLELTRYSYNWASRLQMNLHMDCVSVWRYDEQIDMVYFGDPDLFIILKEYCR